MWVLGLVFVVFVGWLCGVEGVTSIGTRRSGPIALSEDGKRLALVIADGVVATYSLPNLTPLTHLHVGSEKEGVLREEANWYMSVAFSSKNALAVGTHENKLILSKDGTKIDAQYTLCPVRKKGRPRIAWKEGGEGILVGCEGFIRVCDDIKFGSKDCDWKVVNGVSGGVFGVGKGGVMAVMSESGEELIVGERDVWVGSSGVKAIRWGPSGSRCLIATHDRKVRVVDVEGKEELRLVGHQHIVTAAAWINDETLVTGGSQWDGTVRVWELPKGVNVAVYEMRKGLGNVIGLEWGESGGWMVREEGVVMHMKVDGSRLVVEEVFPSDARLDCRSIAWSPHGDDLALVGGHSQTVREIDLSNGNTIHRYQPPHKFRVDAVAWTNGWVASGSWDKRVRLWKEGKYEDEVCVLHDAGDRVVKVGFSSDAKYLAATTQHGGLLVWSLSPHTLCSLHLHIPYTDRARLSTFSWHPTSPVIAAGGSRSGRVMIVDIGVDEDEEVEDGEQMERDVLHIPTTAQSILDLHWHPHHPSLLAIAGEDKHVHLLDTTTKSDIRLHDVNHGHHFAVSTVAWSSDGHYLASTDRIRPTILLWSYPNPTSTPPIVLHAPHVRIFSSLSWHPTQPRLAAASLDGLIDLHTLPTPRSHSHSQDDEL